MFLTKLKQVSFALGLGVVVAGAGVLDSPQSEDRPTPKKTQVGHDLFGDPLPSGAFARLGSGRMRHQDEVDSVAFSPDGKTLAAGDAGAPMKVRLWDVATGKEVRRFEANSCTRSIVFSPDGALLATGDYVGFVHLWEARTGKQLFMFSVRQDPVVPQVMSVLFSPDGKVLASSDDLGAARGPGSSSDIKGKSTRSPFLSTARPWRRAAGTKRSVSGIWPRGRKSASLRATKTVLTRSPFPPTAKCLRRRVRTSRLAYGM